MRRTEFDIKDDNSINEVLETCEYGTLSLISSGKPYGIALNFVYYKNAIYFHGAKEGKKIEAIKESCNCSFLVVNPYSFIPSYFSNTIAACPATQFFASVLVEGTLSFVENGEEKADILNALMKKFQSEDSFEKISYDKTMYTKMLDKTAIIKLSPKNISCKIKMGQNLTNERRDVLLGHLEKEDTKISKDTLNLIKLYNN